MTSSQPAPRPPRRRAPLRLFARGSFPESSRVGEILRAETTGGMLLIAGALVAIVWANTPWSDAYTALRDWTVGPAALHLDLSLGAWAADGLLAIFFFVAGLELKREFVAGDLRDVRRAALPVVAAVAGMTVPALVFVAVNLGAGGGLKGWAIPTATDIAFAVAILAVISTHLPSGLRTFLLTLAVVDDLLAITIIAVFYTSELHLLYLALAVVPIAVFGFLVQRRIHRGWLLMPLAFVAWTLVHASGVHATVAGVALAFTVPVLRRDGQDGAGLAEHLEHVVRPVSAGIAVPVFAFFAAGVTVGGLHGLAQALRDPIALGIVAGLVVGKTVGIAGSTWALATFTRADLDDELSWTDVIGMSMLAGIGFTVSLLIGELAYGTGSGRDDHVKVGVLIGSLVATVCAAAVLRTRNRAYRRICEMEEVDADADGIPDVFQRDGREEPGPA
ncbi:Na+/H+ antiporter NhaA [Nocardioides ungokensis]